MRRSFRRMVLLSVLLTWALSFLLIAVYTQPISWGEQRAEKDGVFLMHELLDEVPAPERPDRLAELSRHHHHPLALIPVAEVEERVGRSARAGEAILHRPYLNTEWYFVVFTDGSQALAVGPVDRVVPPGMFPFGFLTTVFSVPIIAALLALRIEGQLRKVERASEAIAVGELSARVDAERGPSRELAAKFNAMADRVERLVRSRDELVQAVSHELGSPLSRLRFHIELLHDGPEEERADRTAAMTEDLDALDELVAELLTYVQSEDNAIAKVEFDPLQTLRHLAELAELEVPDGDEVSVEVAAGRDVPLVADQRLFQRAVENLLRNAVRHAKAQIRLELHDDTREVRVAVHDDGPGIPPELREQVTRPFVRLESHRSRETGGVGLGLAIVSRIVQRHDGRIEIGDSPLGGAVVSTIWPKA